MGKKLEFEKDDNFEDFFSREQEDMSKQLPREYTDSYNILSLISETSLHKSYLLEDKKQHFKLLLKTGTGEALTLLSAEAKMGERVVEALGNEKGRVISYKEIEGTGYLLRHYIEGMNLKEYSERRVVLTAEEIYDVMHILCHKISILHKLNPPVIHRDIKPENIIIYAKEGHVIDVHLIDFGTARSFDEKKQYDTIFVGTRQTAAPEQYGFSQTNERTDIYGLGKVLCYMLTGGFTVEDLKGIGYGRLHHMHLSMAEYRNMRKAVVKATELDPDKRYSGVKQFESAFSKTRGINKTGYVIAASILIACMLAGAYYTGLSIQKKRDQALMEAALDVSELQDYEDDKSPSLDNTPDTGSDIDKVSDNVDEDNALSASDNSNVSVETLKDGSVVFESELLKEAVLKNLPKGTVITKDTLSKVRSIRIIGQDCFGYDSEIWAYRERVFVDGVDYPLSNVGDVTDLSLIAEMDNLEELYLANQNLTDISALAGCPVKTLFLNCNQIEDFSVLETMPNLQNLYIGNNPISEVPDLTKCSHLRFLNLNHLFLNDIKPLVGLNLNEMEIQDTRVLDNDYSVLKEMPELYRLTLGVPESGMVEILNELDAVTDLAIDSWSENNIDSLLGMEKLEMLSISSEYLNNISGIEKLSNIKKIYLDGSSRINDVSGIEKLNYLQEFAVTSDVIEDVTPICNLSPNITLLRLSEVVADKVIEQKPELDGKIIINY